MNRKFYGIAALAIILLISGGIYAYTYATGVGTISITSPTGDIATANISANQPDWEDVVELVEDTETFRPSDNGTYIQCDPVGDVDNFLCVDEETADEDSTYVETSGGATELDTYNIPDHSEGTGNITSVNVYIRTRATFGTHAAEVAMRTDGTNSFASYTSPLPTSYGYLSANWDNNPNTTDPWTWDEIDALEIGVRQYDLGRGGPRTTQVYAEVDYEYLPITGNTPTGDLFEVNEHPDYGGDLNVRVYLTNTAALLKAYEYLNMELYLEDSEEAGQTPNYQLLTPSIGWVSFTLKDPVSDNHVLSITGGDYGLVSAYTAEWEAGWTITPELYCEVAQR